MRNYITGFILSITLTITAFLLVTNNLLNGWILILIVAALALIQFWVQAIFFLHLDLQSSRWNLAAFLATLSLILILVTGSLWIMNNLNYRHATSETDQQIFRGEAIPR